MIKIKKKDYSLHDKKMKNENPIIENDLANNYEETKEIQEDMKSDN